MTDRKERKRKKERGVSASKVLKEPKCIRNMQSDTGNIPWRKRAGGALVQTGKRKKEKIKERKIKTKQTWI